MKLLRIILLITLFFILLGLYLNYFVVKNLEQKDITWGIDFSQMQAENLGLDSKETFSAILQDLGVKNIKLHTHWNFVEKTRDSYVFDDIDWQIHEAGKNNAKLIYVVGMKTGRWPECHEPQWLASLSHEEQEEELLEYINEVILRYKNEDAIAYWQAENEPLFTFGNCPLYRRNFLKKEVALIKSLDSSRQVIVSDSGEWSSWLRVANIGDIIGTTMYRRVWTHIYKDIGFYADLPFPPSYYWIKSEIIKKIFNKKAINVELQAEPWTHEFIPNVTLTEQERTMNLDQFNRNVNYAKRTGFDTFYFWGTEWWYWLKEKHHKPEIWNEAKKLF